MKVVKHQNLVSFLPIENQIIVATESQPDTSPTSGPLFITFFTSSPTAETSSSSSDQRPPFSTQLGRIIGLDRHKDCVTRIISQNSLIPIRNLGSCVVNLCVTLGASWSYLEIIICGEEIEHPFKTSI